MPFKMPPPKEYECSQCEFLTESADILKVHTFRKHRINTGPSSSGVVLPTPFTVSRLPPAPPSTKPQACPRCPNMFNSFEDMTNHYRTEHFGRPVCQFLFRNGVRCDKQQSTTSASEFCNRHRDMCQHPECLELAKDGKDKAAARGSDFCAAHGGGRRCQHPECLELAKDGKDKAAARGSDRCIEHGGGRRCPNCIDWIDSRGGNPKYDWYCATCFKQRFPDDPRSKVVYAHTKEIRVRNMINEHFEGFCHDITLPMWLNGCNCTHKRRVDHWKIIEGVMLAIETDEYAHRGYSRGDEAVRYEDLMMAYSGKWIYIRFNPDGEGPDMEDRLEVLKDAIEEQIERIQSGRRGENEDLVEITYMYYPEKYKL